MIQLPTFFCFGVDSEFMRAKCKAATRFCPSRERMERFAGAPELRTAAAPASRPIEMAGESWVATDLTHETFSDSTWRDRWIVEGGRIRYWWIASLTRARTAAAAGPVKPWFKSGFESGVELRRDESARRPDAFVGRDVATAFDCPQICRPSAPSMPRSS